jgi:hypothetical protein
MPAITKAGTPADRRDRHVAVAYAARLFKAIDLHDRRADASPRR